MSVDVLARLNARAKKLVEQIEAIKAEIAEYEQMVVELSRQQMELEGQQEELATVVEGLRRLLPDLFVPGDPDLFLMLPGLDHDRKATEPEQRLIPLRNPAAERFAGKTILQCCLILLQEAGGSPLHYRRLAEMALAGGYHSSRQTTDPEDIRRSFWDTLRRAKDRADIPLEFRGRGMFRFNPSKNVNVKVEDGPGDEDSDKDVDQLAVNGTDSPSLTE